MRPLDVLHSQAFKDIFWAPPAPMVPEQDDDVPGMVDLDEQQADEEQE